MILRRSHRIVVIATLVLTVTLGALAAQHRTTKKKKPAVPATPPPPTLQNCGASLRIPPGWQLMRASEYEKAHPELASDEPSKSSDESADNQPKSADNQPKSTDNQPATQPVEPLPAVPQSQAETPTPQTTEPAPQSTAPEPKPENPCRFVISSKYPSELVRNTDAEGPVGRMEIEIVNADLETAAAQLMEKDEKGWYVNGPNGTRYDARLSKPKRGLQTLTAVIVEACHDLNGKYRSLCESNRYVYSNGHRSALISAGPYLGETESTLLTSLRFAPINSTRSRNRH
jgi:cell division protein FtsN